MIGRNEDKRASDNCNQRRRETTWKEVSTAKALRLEGKDAMDFIREERRLERERSKGRGAHSQERGAPSQETPWREKSSDTESSLKLKKTSSNLRLMKNGSVSMKLRRKNANVNVH